jgi:HEAT repeat protein
MRRTAARLLDADRSDVGAESKGVSMSGQGEVRAEEIVRALAVAAAAVRLYPPTSEIPAQTVDRLVRVSEAVTSAARSPVRFAIEPKSFKIGDQLVGEGQAQVAGLAEMLYAHQVGQLIVAPGVTAEETSTFLRCVGSDPSAVREEGGLRHVMVTAGVTHIAVIELTLRASNEEGLAGLDLTSAPLEVLGPAVLRSAADWARSAASGSGRDELAEVIGGLESAARELAMERVAQALLQLDEQTRGAVLAAAVRQDASGQAMEGMLAVIANMRPAQLARLLILAAGRTGGDPNSIMSRLTLPPEAMRALQLLLRPSPRSESESGVPASIDAVILAGDAVESDEDEDALAAAKLTLSSDAAAVRALVTTTHILERSPTPESVDAIGEALPGAVAAGAFGAAHSALALLENLTSRPELDTAIARTRHVLANPDALARGAAAIGSTTVARDAATVFAAAGVAGSEAVLDAWLKVGDADRGTLEQIARALPEQIVAGAGRRIRSGDPVAVREIVTLLGRLGDRRAVPSLSQALDHDSPEVRSAAIAAMAAVDTEESWAAVVSSLTHPDEATARQALAAIRGAGRRRAAPAMIAVLQLHSSGTRNHELKREIIEDVRAMGATEALPALRKIAGRAFVWGRKARELRDAARRAVTDLQSEQRTDGEKVRT